MNKPGRSTRYTAALTQEMCTRLIEGQSLVQICLEPGMPHVSTVYRWLASHPEFQASYILARDLQADTLADEILSIADTREIGEETLTKADGSVEVRRADLLTHRRLRMYARMWHVGKLKPKKYGRTAGRADAEDGHDVIRIEDNSEWPGD